jgi:hypothetical protein
MKPEASLLMRRGQVSVSNDATTIDPVDARLDRLLRHAIAEKRLVTFLLHGCRRIAEPHDYGIMKGIYRLFCYQTGGESRSKPGTGWRWATLSEMSQLRVLDGRFAGPRDAPTGQHIQWDVLVATVSPRPVSQISLAALPSRKPRRRRTRRT